MSKDAKFLLIVAMLSAAGMSVAHTFVNVFLIRATDGDIASMMLQNVMNFVMLLLAFITGTKLLVKIPITTILKMGIASTSLYYIAILLLQDHVATFVIPLGMFSGIGMGLFWFAANLLVGEVVKESEQGRYFSYQRTVGFIFGVVTPAVSGFIITQFTDLTGYYLLFGASLIFFGFAALMAKYIPSYTTDVQMRIFEVLKVKNNPYWRAGKLYAFITGLRNAVEGQVTTVFAFIIFADERVMGNVSSVVAIVSIFSCLWFAKVFTQRKKRSFYFITAVLTFITHVFLALFPNPVVLIIAWIVLALIRNWGDTSAQTLMLQLCSRAKAGYDKGEYLIGLEFPMAVGRMIGLFSALGLILAIYNEMYVYRLLFVFIGLVWLVEFFVIDKEVKWLRDDIEEKVGEAHG